VAAFIDVDIESGRWEATRLLLRGWELSDGQWENGLVSWIEHCAVSLSRGDDSSYWYHEIYPDLLSAWRARHAL
jgi:hypothetical protein